MKKVLVTGGAGFIGSHLVDLLVSRGIRVTVIDSLEQQVHSQPPDYLNPGARYVIARSGSTRVNYSDILDGVDTVYYFAAKVGPNQSMTDIADYVDCNIRNLGTFLQALSEHGRQVRRIILSGSMGPYGEGKYRCSEGDHEFYPKPPRKSFDYTCTECEAPASNVALDEHTQINDISYYGLSKNVQESMLRLFAQSNDVEFVSLRYFSVYGPRQAFNNPYAGPIPIWIQRALAPADEDLIVYEDGNQTRDFINVRDITEINYRAGEMSLVNQVEIVNCGTGVATRIINVARAIKKLLKSSADIVITHTIRPGDLRHSLADNAKLGRLFGYEDFVDFHTGLEALIEVTVARLEMA